MDVKTINKNLNTIIGKLQLTDFKLFTSNNIVCESAQSFYNMLYSRKTIYANNRAELYNFISLAYLIGYIANFGNSDTVEKNYVDYVHNIYKLKQEEMSCIKTSQERALKEVMSCIPERLQFIFGCNWFIHDTTKNAIVININDDCKIAIPVIMTAYYEKEMQVMLQEMFQSDHYQVEKYSIPSNLIYTFFITEVANKMTMLDSMEVYIKGAWKKANSDSNFVEAIKSIFENTENGYKTPKQEQGFLTCEINKFEENILQIMLQNYQMIMFATAYVYLHGLENLIKKNSR